MWVNLSHCSLIQSWYFNQLFMCINEPKMQQKMLGSKKLDILKKTYLKVRWKKKLGEIQCPVVFLPELLMTGFLL